MRALFSITLSLALFQSIVCAQDLKVPCPNPARCEVLLPLAANGNAEAQFTLGYMYFYGLGDGTAVRADPVEGEKWWRKAADQGHFNAMLEILKAHSSSKGMDPVAVEMIKSVQNLADQGNSDAQGYLAYALSEGVFGLSKDPAEAVKWWKKSAELGNVDSAYALYTAYCKGSGVKKDKVEADRWFEMGKNSAIAYRWQDGTRGSSHTPEKVPEKSGCNVTFIW